MKRSIHEIAEAISSIAFEDGARIDDTLRDVIVTAIPICIQKAANLPASSEAEAIWNEIAQYYAADRLRALLRLLPPYGFEVFFSGRLHPYISSTVRKEAEQELRSLIDEEPHITHLIVLEFLKQTLEQTSIVGRLKQLPLHLRRSTLSPFLEQQIQSATRLYLWGLDRECIVFCAAALEAALECFDSDSTDPLEGHKDRLARLINAHITDPMLRHRCHRLRDTRNGLLHNKHVEHPQTEDQALRTLVDALDTVAPMPAFEMPF